MLSSDLRCRRLSHAPGQGHCFVRVGCNVLSKRNISHSGAGTLFYPHLTMISRHQQYSPPKMNNIPHPRESSKKTKGAIKNETPIPRNPNSPPVPLLTSRDRIPPLSPRQVHFHPSATNRNTSTAFSHKSQQRYRRRPAKKTPDKTIPPGMADTHPLRKHQ